MTRRPARALTFALRSGAPLSLALLPFLACGPAAAPVQSPAGVEIPDSIAHPIVAACGERIDPPAYLREAVAGEPTGAARVAALDRIEQELRRSNAPLGETWHDPEITREERAAVLTSLQDNYRAWWAEVEEVLGARRAREILDAPPAQESDSGPARRVRCIGRSLLSVLGL